MQNPLERAQRKLRKLNVLRKARAAASSGRVDHPAIFDGVSDDLWLSLNTVDYRRFPELQAVLPSMPDAQLQADYVGSSGDTALSHAFRAYHAWRELAGVHGHALERDSRVLDFGCGWGRTLRFFMRDVVPGNLVGVDVMPPAIDVCRATNRWCDFRVTPAMPPTELPPGSFDLIYLYSVFSHLSEEAVDAWVTEFSRIMKPGGLLIATTWDRNYIALCEQSRHGPTPGTHSGSPEAFRGGVEPWFARYDAGEICHSPVGGGPLLPGSFYGETCIPCAYVQRKWSDRFEFREFIDADRDRFLQSVIVVQKLDKTRVGAPRR